MERKNGRLTSRVTVVVQVLDDFTDRVISGSAVQVRAVGLMAKPIRKSDGYFVFTADQGPIRQIAVESLFYEKEIVTLEPKALNPRHPVLKIRLKPNRRYTAPEPMTGLEGRAEPGSEIQVIYSSHPQPLKLLYDYKYDGREKGREIRLFHPEKKDLSGRTMAILSKEHPEPELFHILEMTDREQGICRLSKALSRSYKKIGATVLPVYTTRTDEEGNFFLFLPGLTGKKTVPYRIQAVGAKTVLMEPKLTQGIINRLDLLNSQTKGRD